MQITLSTRCASRYHSRREEWRFVLIAFVLVPAAATLESSRCIIATRHLSRSHPREFAATVNYGQATIRRRRCLSRIVPRAQYNEMPIWDDFASSNWIGTPLGLRAGKKVNMFVEWAMLLKWVLNSHLRFPTRRSNHEWAKTPTWRVPIR